MFDVPDSDHALKDSGRLMQMLWMNSCRSFSVSCHSIAVNGMVPRKVSGRPRKVSGRKPEGSFRKPEGSFCAKVLRRAAVIHRPFQGP